MFPFISSSALLGQTIQRGGILLALRASKLYYFVSMGYSYLGKKSSCAGYIAREKACRKLNRNRGQIKTDLHSLVRPSAYNSCLHSEEKAEYLRP